MITRAGLNNRVVGSNSQRPPPDLPLSLSLSVRFLLLITSIYNRSLGQEEVIECIEIISFWFFFSPACVPPNCSDYWVSIWT